MISDWIFDHFQELFLRVRGANRESMQQLDHKTSETLECTWDSDCGADFDEDAFSGSNIDLKKPSLVNW